MNLNQHLYLEFGPKFTDNIYIRSESRWYRYDKQEDREFIHQKFGGKFFYHSISGKTGKGWIKENNDIFIFGSLSKKYQYAKIFTTMEYTDGILYCYYDNDNHGIIVSNGEHIVIGMEYSGFSDPKRIISLFLERYNYQEKEFVYYDKNGKQCIKQYFLKLNQIEEDSQDIVNYKKQIYRFLDIQRVNFEEDNLHQDDELTKTLGIYHNKEYSKFFHIKYGVILRVWKSIDEIFEHGSFRGWNKESKSNLNIYSKYVPDSKEKADGFISIIAEKDRYDKFYEKDMYRKVYYEVNLSRIDVLLKSDLEIENDLFKALKKKEIADFRYWKENDIEYVRNILNGNKDHILSKNDSIDSGNCPVGTQNFIDLYFPGSSQQTFQDILNHEKFDVMISDHHFRKAILHSLLSKEV